MINPLNTIKKYAAIIVIGFAAFASALAAIFKSQRDKAIAQKDQIKTDLDKSIEVNTHNDKVRQVQDEIQAKADEVDLHSDDRVIAELRKYDRARSDNQD